MYHLVSEVVKFRNLRRDWNKRVYKDILFYDSNQKQSFNIMLGHKT